MYKDEENWIRLACFVFFTQSKLELYLKNLVIVM
jgi:hypothetical protein